MLVVFNLREEENGFYRKEDNRSLCLIFLNLFFWELVFGFDVYILLLLLYYIIFL